MKPLIFWIPVLTFGLGSIQVGAQPAPEFARLLPEAGAVDRLQRLEWQATGDHFDPGQTVVAGGYGRHTSSYTLQGTWEPSGQASYQWDVDIHYPFLSNWQYSETFGPAGTGTIDGADGFRPSATAELAPARVGARAKFLWMGAPALLLSEAVDVFPVGGQPDSYAFVALGTTWVVNLDSETGLPATLSTTENDPIFGSVQTSVDYSSWQDVNGVMVPAQLEYRVDGDIIRRELRNSLSVVLGSRSDRPDYSAPRSVPMYSRGWNMAHWFIRRIALGGPMDTDQSRPVEFLEVGDGVYQVLGSSHHNLIIELDDGLVVVDAPLYPSRSEAVLEALTERWPNKPVRHLILSHHHYDHSGGLATYAAAGIPITMHSRNRELFFDAFVRQGLGVPDIRGVGEETHLEIGGRTISLYEIPTVHTDGMFGVYLPDEKLIFIVDNYSPGQESRNQLWASEALSAVRFLGVPVERLVGGHGRGTHTLAEAEATVER